jgi:anti-sigma regulatory factor (Ser/Thr protein kinase)
MAGIWRLFLARPEAVPAARMALRDFEYQDDSVQPVVELLASELVTNAIRHGASDPHESILLRALHVDGTVRVEVCDEGLTQFDGPPPGTDLLEPGGNGLLLVEALSSRWGIDHGRPKCVWFEADAAGVA